MTREAAEIAEREGIDVWLIKRQLEKSPTERLLENESAKTLLTKLQIAGKVLRGERESC